MILSPSLVLNIVGTFRNTEHLEFRSIGNCDKGILDRARVIGLEYMAGGEIDGLQVVNDIPELILHSGDRVTCFVHHIETDNIINSASNPLNFSIFGGINLKSITFVDKIKFKGSDLSGLFQELIIEELDLSNLVVDNIELMKCTFKGLRADKLILRNWRFSPKCYMENTFVLASIHKLILEDMEFTENITFYKVFLMCNIQEMNIKNVKISNTDGLFKHFVNTDINCDSDELKQRIIKASCSSIKEAMRRGLRKDV